MFNIYSAITSGVKIILLTMAAFKFQYVSSMPLHPLENWSLILNYANKAERNAT